MGDVKHLREVVSRIRVFAVTTPRGEEGKYLTQIARACDDLDQQLSAAATETCRIATADLSLPAPLGTEERGNRASTSVSPSETIAKAMEGVEQARLAIRVGGSMTAYAYTETADDGDYMTVEDAKRMFLDLASLADLNEQLAIANGKRAKEEYQRAESLALKLEAMQREMAELREVRAGGRDAAATLHDALMAERALTQQLSTALEMISAESKESNEPIGRSVFKALATCGEIADVALRARTLIQGEKK